MPTRCSLPNGELFLNRYDEVETPHVYKKPVTGYKGESVYALQRHFVHCLLHDAPCESEGAEYLKTVAALFACYESAATQCVVTIPSF